MTVLRNFPPDADWDTNGGRLTPLAQGLLRSLFDYVGASTTGTIPPGSIGAPGTTDVFYRGDGTFSVINYGATPSALAGLTAIAGSATTWMRSDGSPAINQGIAPTWTAAHIFTAATTMTSLVMAGTLTGVTSITTSGSATIGTGFGCNGKAAQTSATVNAAISATAGAAYTATEQGMLNDLKALVNQIRAALVADGIAV
jgi:hypothetical protein